MSPSKDIIPPESDFLLYTTPEGDVRVDVLFAGETVWLTQRRMAELFATSTQNITLHLKNIYSEGEIKESATCKEYLQVRMEGAREVKRPIQFYSLDAIIAVGYRVSSEKATQFRIWATQVLRNYIVKGFAIDDERLKQGARFGKDYFDELLEKIREIRASERRFYQKITDLYAEASIDYDAEAEITKTFFKTVQNKLHWAITGQTAAELIAGRADSKKPKMGLLTWKNAPQGKILKSDVSVAKNYLRELELSEMNRIVTMYLDYAENQAKKHRPLRMTEWAEKLDAFLRFNEYEILDNPGKVSHEIAKALAEKEYETYRVIQDREFISDFDRETQRYFKELRTVREKTTKRGGRK